MCLEDITIARVKKTTIYFTTTTATIPANPRRLSIRLVPNSGDTSVLRALNQFCQGSNTIANVRLGFCAYASELVVADGLATKPDDVTLDNVGGILLRELQLQSLKGVGVFAIETYFDVDTPEDIDITKLGGK